ncbi:polyribonucleotide nucleotidyltransferase [Spirochaeta africana]|uniref:Polyribonucleotide nucleotidyltransferase n=1 Tax=Spirochaeta africana (strain ATCC 700263 / DSM 8902 / Z-7692) TaxID=889378 RepID=H9UJA1_SPIAZ|nr:polyribonucleotide nucleotidyltransferase [Spirochaeta africana]AFG37594.1 polyribonucleotide nucleotidyltransferase [Spirochaeta africana DSM 8902]
MFDTKEVRVKVGQSELILETGRMAKQANGAVFARMEGTAVIATACCGSSIKEDLDFVPLSVEYNEKYYAAGKIPGGFLKREGRPKDKEVLVCRLIDRPMRPLFSKDFKREIQVVPTVISTDQINPPDVTAMCAASAAVTISDIPFEGPVAAVRVGYVNGEYIINPTFPQIEEGDLDIIVAGTHDGITMVEGGGQEVSEEILLNAIELAHESIVRICDAQLELRKLAGKEKLGLVEAPAPLEKQQEILDYARPKMMEACFVLGKFTRGAAIKAVKTETLEKFRDSIPEDKEKQFSSLFHDLEQEIVRESILKNKKRTDGRAPDGIRPITCEIDVLPRTHGAALFTRGETQALAITTLGTVYDEQIMDDIEGDRRENFMLHYNFPPFSVGETGRMGTGRREIGHGHLAHRSLSQMLPGKEGFPYTIRVVSEVLESNGSSSMATVCGGTLSLLNAGVPLKRPVAGIAMGLITDGTDSVVLSDILGEEDHLGDMDFKVAGTTKGITAFQMDIKVKRIKPEVMKTALEQARQGRLHILSAMDQVIDKPRENLSEYAPRIINFKVDPEKIGMLIGPGGKTIKSINEKFSVETNIENDGTVTIYCRESKSAEQAKAAFIGLLEEPEIGRVYDGVVRRIVDFGAFIEFLPGKEGLCHISKMSSQRINDVNDVLELGQEVPVRIIEIDKMGRVNLSLIYEGADEAGSSDNRPPRRDSRPPRPRR